MNEAPDKLGKKGPGLGSLVLDLVLCVVLAAICGRLGIYLTGSASSPTPQQWWFAAMTSLGCSIPILFLMHSPVVANYPVAAPLLATFWRGTAYLGLLYVGTATNWLGDNFDVICLQGCYFPFLVLESALFLKRVRV